MKPPSPESLLFINCEKFQVKIFSDQPKAVFFSQGPTNLERMKKFTGHPGSVGLPSNVVTLKEVIFSNSVAFVTKLQASHYAPTDIPIILEGSRAGSVARMLGVTGGACIYLHFSFQPSLLAGVPGPTSNLAYLTITSDLVRSWVRGSTGEGWEELLADVRGAGEAVQVGMQDQ